MPEGIWLAVLIATWGLLLMQTGMIVILGRHLRRLHQDYAPDTAAIGLALGAEAPEIEVTDLQGQHINLGGSSPQPRLLVFLSPGCAGCRSAIRELPLVRLEGAHIVLLWNGSQAQTHDLADEYRIGLPMVADVDQRLWKQFQITSVPFAMVVNEAGYVTAKGLAGRADQFERLLGASSTAESVAARPAAGGLAASSASDGRGAVGANR